MMKYQQKNGDRTIGHLKQRWADNGLSPRMFFDEFFKQYTKLNYRDFCFLINWDESITDDLRMAIDDFWRASG